MITRPVLIMGCPRSGTTLLFNILSEVPALWSIGYESKQIIERHHHPREKGWVSGALEASDLTRASRAYILGAFRRQAASGLFWRRVNRMRGWLRGKEIWGQIKERGRSRGVGSRASSLLPQLGLDVVRAGVRARNSLHTAEAPVRLVEKTPENCLRLPFLLALFPDAQVIFLTRDGRSNISSLMEGWRQPHLFPGYRVPKPVRIPELRRERWAFTLIPEWRELTASPLEIVCAWQWVRCNEAVLEHRESAAGQVPYLTVRYEDLVGRPGETLAQVAAFLDIDFDSLRPAAERLPRVNIVSEPSLEKWRQANPEAILRIMPLIEPVMKTLGYDSSSR